MKQQTLLVLLLVLSAACVNSVYAAKMQVQIFSLQHRSAASVEAKIAPLLEQGERLSASDNQLVLIASPLTLEATSKLLATLDRPVEQYLVEVRWLEGVDVAPGRLGYDPVTQHSLLPDRGQALGTSSRQVLQQLRVIAGDPAFLVTGKDIPYKQKWAAWSGQNSSGFAASVAYQPIRTGFEIRVQPLQTDILEVDIVPQLMAAGRGDVLTPPVLTLDRLATRVRIPPNQWVDLSRSLGNSTVGLEILSGQDTSVNAGRRLQLRITSID